MFCEVSDCYEAILPYYSGREVPSLKTGSVCLFVFAFAFALFVFCRFHFSANNSLEFCSTLVRFESESL